MGLRAYKQKRNFQVTPEPPGKEKGSKGKRLRFVIQKHHASRLHYDFRLEHHHVLLSWAVPKGPSNDPGDKRLAVRVEDHPYEYKDFEGIIPEGEYGAGEVIVWDEGTFTPEFDGKPIDSRSEAERVIEEGLEKGKLSFSMDGKKMHGSWTLIKIRGQEKNWLLVKHEDEFADNDDGLTEDDRSIKSGKTLDELKDENEAGGNVAKWSSNRSKKNVSTIAAARAKLAGGTRVPISEEKKADSSVKRKKAKTGWSAPITPMLAYLVDSPFSREGWIYEPKLDGIRAVAYIQDGEVRLLSRRGLDLTVRYPLLAEALSSQKHDMIIDGEIVALDKSGRPSFQMLQQRSGLSLERDVNRAEGEVPVQFYVFDILQLETKRTVDLPLKQRKELLKKNLRNDSTIRIVDGLPGDGESAFIAAVENGLEGIVAKRLDSLYEAGRRSRNWLKIKATKSNEFVICGFTEGTGARQGSFGALVLGYYDREGKLVYAGSVGTGFNNKSLSELKKAMKPLITSTCPFTRNEKRVKAKWLKPELVAEVKYAEWTQDRILRIPVFLHLRPDIDPKETGLPKLISADAAGDSPNDAHPPVEAVVDKTSKESESSSEQMFLEDPEIKQLLEQLDQPDNQMVLEVQGEKVKFSNLNKVLWPAVSPGSKEYSKRDYIKYLLRMSHVILPQMRNRPLTFIRFPNGIHGTKFFQKHWDKDMPPFVESIRYFSEQNGGDETYMMGNNLPTLLWAGQMGALELHTVHTRIDPWPDGYDLSTKFTGSVENIEGSLLNYPDYAVIDLDPYIYSGKEAHGTDPELNKIGFSKTCEIAIALHEILEQLGIKTFVKTSGRTGLHIYVPLIRNINEDAARAFAATIGNHILAKYPNDVTVEWAKVKRTGKIFFDYNMNARGKTLPSAYTLRTAEVPSVSCPLKWEEVGKIYPTELTLENVPSRVDEIGDLWANILGNKTDLRQLVIERRP